MNHTLFTRRSAGCTAKCLAGLVAFELRSLRALTLGVLGVGVGLLAVTLLVQPVQLDLLSAGHCVWVTAFTFVAGLPLVAQAFGGGERDAALSTFRSAPLASGWAVLAKLTAIALGWLGLWVATLLATAAAKSLGPAPDALHSLDLSALVDGGLVLVMFGMMAGLGYLSAALIAITSRHALAATLGGLVGAAAPVGLLLALGQLRDSSLVGLLLGWTHLAAVMGIQPIGCLGALAALLAVFRLRGRGTRSGFRRTLRASAIGGGLVLALPVTGLALGSLQSKAGFHAPRTRTADVAVHPTLPRVAIVTYDFGGWWFDTTIWSVDPLTGDARRLADPSAAPFYLASAQMLNGWVDWSPASERLYGSYQVGPADNNLRFFALDPATNAIERMEYAEWLIEASQHGWVVERAPAATPGGKRRFRISRPGVDALTINATYSLVFDGQEPTVLHYLDVENRLHRLDGATREDRILDVGTLTGKRHLTGSPDGRWCLIRETRSTCAELVDTRTGQHREVRTSGSGWTKRERPLLERNEASGASWTLQGLGESVELVPEVPCHNLHDIDGEHWLGQTRDGGLLVLDPTGALLRRLK